MSLVLKIYPNKIELIKIERVKDPMTSRYSFVWTNFC